MSNPYNLSLTTLLSCDTAADGKHGVLVFMTYTALFSTGLIGIAGVAAPIGLGESISSAILASMKRKSREIRRCTNSNGYPEAPA